MVTIFLETNYTAGPRGQSDPPEEPENPNDAPADESTRIAIVEPDLDNPSMPPDELDRPWLVRG